MPTYSYQAKSEDGKIIKGEMNSDNPDELTKQLADQRLLLENYQEKDAKKLVTFSLMDKLSKIKSVDKIFFTQNLEVMIRTGFSVSVALSAIAEQTSNKKFKKIILDLKQEVERGVTLAKALRKYPKVFPKIFINMIEAGEISGKLEQILKRLTIQMKKDNTLKAKVKGAMIYPVIITVAMFGIGIFVLIFVIPKISAVYEEAGANLPIITQLLITTGNFLANNTIIFFISLAAIIIAFKRIISTKKGKRIYHKILLKTPVAGPIIKKINLARFTRTLSSLLKTDIPIVQSFNIIAQTLGNVIYQEFIRQASRSLEKGDSLKKILVTNSQLFPPVVTQMIAVGEESGTLDSITEEAANFYEEEIDQTMSNLTVIIEPILMIVLGVAIGGMAAAIIMPMYNLASVI